jgi:hypothetical protein
MIKTLFLFLLLAPAAFAQHTFELKNASKYFDVKVEVESCEDGSCKGPATFSFYRKSGGKAYQVISLPDTYIQLDDSDGKPLVNRTLMYDDQSVINVDDFNFDGMEDVAICDGTNGSYNGPSYQVYLSNRARGQFVHSAPFTKLGYRLGMFEVDKGGKTLQTSDKSGCCWHITERYKVVAGKPVKVFEFVEDATGFDEKKNMRIIKSTTKTLVGGKWRTKTEITREKEEPMNN